MSGWDVWLDAVSDVASDVGMNVGSYAFHWYICTDFLTFKERKYLVFIYYI